MRFLARRDCRVGISGGNAAGLLGFGLSRAIIHWCSRGRSRCHQGAQVECQDYDRRAQSRPVAHIVVRAMV